MNDIGEASYEERGPRSTGDDTEVVSEPKNMSWCGVRAPQPEHGEVHLHGRTHSGKEHGGE